MRVSSDLYTQTGMCMPALIYEDIHPSHVHEVTTRSCPSKAKTDIRQPFLPTLAVRPAGPRVLGSPASLLAC